MRKIANNMKQNSGLHQFNSQTLRTGHVKVYNYNESF